MSSSPPVSVVMPVRNGKLRVDQKGGGRPRSFSWPEGSEPEQTQDGLRGKAEPIERPSERCRQTTDGEQHTVIERRSARVNLRKDAQCTEIPDPDGSAQAPVQITIHEPVKGISQFRRLNGRISLNHEGDGRREILNGSELTPSPRCGLRGASGSVHIDHGSAGRTRNGQAESDPRPELDILANSEIAESAECAAERFLNRH